MLYYSPIASGLLWLEAKRQLREDGGGVDGEHATQNKVPVLVNSVEIKLCL